jgi:hypothetical protein
MGCAIFDAWSAADEALVNSHWIAEKTAAALAGAVRIEGAEADRAAMERVLGDLTVTGVAFFGHGREDHLRDASGAPVLDEGNLALIGGRWFHGFACLSGKRLAGLARRAGVAASAGYEVRVVVELTPRTAPPGPRRAVRGVGHDDHVGPRRRMPLGPGPPPAGARSRKPSARGSTTTRTGSIMTRTSASAWGSRPLRSPRLRQGQRLPFALREEPERRAKLAFDGLDIAA